MKKYLIVCWALFAALAAQAQTMAENGNGTVAPTGPTAESGWVFSFNQEQVTLYIDFSRLEGEAMYLDVRNSSDSSLVQRDELIQIPPNVIYELDMRPYGKGSFSVEVVTYKSVARHTVEVR